MNDPHSHVDAEPCQEARDRDPAPLRAQIREGISWLWSHAYLRTSALIFAGGNFVFSGIYLVFVVIASGLGSRQRRSER